VSSKTTDRSQRIDFHARFEDARLTVYYTSSMMDSSSLHPTMRLHEDSDISESSTHTDFGYVCRYWKRGARWVAIFISLRPSSASRIRTSVRKKNESPRWILHLVKGSSNRSAEKCRLPTMDFVCVTREREHFFLLFFFQMLEGRCIQHRRHDKESFVIP